MITLFANEHAAELRAKKKEKVMQKIRVSRGEIVVEIGYRDHKLTWDEARALRDALTLMLDKGQGTEIPDKEEEADVA